MSLIGTVRDPSTGAATNIFDLTNGASMAINFNRVEGFSYSSGSGLDAAQAAMLSGIDTKTATISENVDAIKVKTDKQKNATLLVGGEIIV